MKSASNVVAPPVVKDVADFNPRSGSWLERLLFNHRIAVLVLCALATALQSLRRRRDEEVGS